MKRPLLITEQDAYSTIDLQRLSEVFDVHQAGPKSQMELVSLVREFRPEVLMVGLGLVVGKNEVSGVENLRFIVSPTTGSNHLHTDELETLGIRVVTLRDMMDGLRSVSSTSELAWGLLLVLARRLISAVDSTSAGEWQREKFQGQQLRNKTLGIVGLGRLGRFVAQYGLAFGMRVIATDSEVTVSQPDVSLVTLRELLTDSDVVSIHVPLNTSTRGMIGIEEIKEMKAGSLLVNTSRGEVVDESAVASALRSGHLGGYGTDVLSGDSAWAGVVQPNPISEVAAEGFNVVITPHLGGYTHEAVSHTRQLVVDYVLNLEEYRSS
jgi:D-3-phosphoglycerate dehydrogenase